IAVFSAITASCPPFLLGLLAILTFSIQLHLLPSGDVFSIGRQVSPLDWLRHIILPATVLALINAGRLIRYVRASLLDVLSADYLITARAKGLSSRQVIVGHALPNALLPVISVVGLQLSTLLGGRLPAGDRLQLAGDWPSRIR